jgi:peptidoglycan/xylan/chitin deacetylase (PgdA/CDA1 family)
MQPLILMYHRIADEPLDHWGLAVSPERFDEQLRVLRRTRHPLPLAEFVRNFVAGTLPQGAVALTFDDGYADNLQAGLPRLAAADVPATVFLATGYLDDPGPFWWDELAQRVLTADGPNSSEIVVRGQTIHLEFPAETAERENGAVPAGAPNGRTAVLERVYEPLRQLNEAERRSAMIELRAIFPAGDDQPHLGRAMTSDEVRILAASGLVTIGAHSVTHPSLTRLRADALEYEVVASRLACEALVGVPVEAFVYPFGEFNAEVRDTVRKAGFAFAGSSQRGPITGASDLFALPRVYVANLDGDAFERRLRAISGDG